MAVKKLKWVSLMATINPSSILSSYSSDFSAIDTLLNAQVSANVSELNNLYVSVAGFLSALPSNKWADLDIYISSWKQYDDRFIRLLGNKIREYIGFYKKILTDNGVQRNLVYAKTYNASGSASSTERGFNSTTPQNSSLYDSTHPESDSLFDQAIADYASSIDKNKASSTTSSQGGSRTTVSGTTWDEQKKNLLMFFYNELKDFIMSIPERIYHYYSLETIPAPELYKKMLENIEQVKDIVINE